MGITHIFILEDIDSNTHYEIAAKYGDKVSLASVVFVLSAEEKRYIEHLKETGEKGGQATCVKAGLKYIQEHYDYDWCFIIDNDEFLTLGQKNLNSVLSLYNNYDAFIMAWECYGANGLVHKPDYSKRGVVDTYLTLCKGHVPLSSPVYDKKICFNLKTYKEDFWENIHVPKDSCNFCNTDRQKEKYKNCYTNIYIRHYITKSWEEYLWKKRTRGYFFGVARTYNAFFTINPEMLPQKQELIENIEGETLVVLPYAGSGAQGHELEIALTAWKKFCRFKYHFVIIGDCPRNLVRQFNWVEWISCGKIALRPDQYSPHLDMQHKMEIAYEKFKDKYEGFIWMVDDNYAVHPFTLQDIKTVHFHQLSFTGNSEAPKYFWKYDKYKTRLLLDAAKLPHHNYTTHYPCYFEFDKLKEIWDKYDLRNNSYVVEDIYFNSVRHAQPVLDTTIRYGVWGPVELQDLDNALVNPDIKFVCNSREGWCPELEEKLWNHIRKD